MTLEGYLFPGNEVYVASVRAKTKRATRVRFHSLPKGSARSRSARILPTPTPGLREPGG